MQQQKWTQKEWTVLISILLTVLSLFWGVSQTVYSARLEARLSENKTTEIKVDTQEMKIKTLEQEVSIMKLEQATTKEGLSKDIEYIKQTITEIKNRLYSYLKLSSLGGP